MTTITTRNGRLGWIEPDHDLAVLVLALVQEVLRLEVPVHHALAVHVGDGVEHLRC